MRSATSRRAANRRRRGRAGVEPVGVVDDDEERCVLRRRGEQRERRCADREPIGLPPFLETERDPKRGRLVWRQALDPRKERPAELQEPGELELGLGLDAGGPRHRHRPGEPDRIPQERRLPDPGLAANDEHATLPCARVLEQLLDPLLLRAPADEQHGATLLPGRCRSQ